jgi:UDP:flavonoid glycosyltransferase YjiC (YdhE family)
MTEHGDFLIVTWDGGGNVPPAIALGARLAMAGHRVRLLGPASVAASAAASGLEWAPYRSVPPWPEGVAFEDDWDLFDATLNGRLVIDDLLAEAGVRAPDVLVVDCLMGAALAAAEYLDVPTAVLVHVLYQPFAEEWGVEVVDVVGPRVALGLGPVDGSLRDVLARADRVLALTPPGFDFPITDLPDNTSYVGPIAHPAPPRDDPSARFRVGPDERSVLISLSTTLQGQRDALPRILDAVEQLQLRGVLTLGGALSRDAIRAPAGVDVIDHVPHAAVLPHVSAAICHGGLSTVTVALQHGVPMVCIPQGREQPLNAERVQACGAGLMLPPDATAASIAEAVDAVLTDPAYREAASGFAALIAEAGAGSDACRMVEGLLQNGRAKG